MCAKDHIRSWGRKELVVVVVGAFIWQGYKQRQIGSERTGTNFFFSCVVAIHIQIPNNTADEIDEQSRLVVLMSI